MGLSRHWGERLQWIYFWRPKIVRKDKTKQRCGQNLRWNERIQAGCPVLGLGLLASDHANFMTTKRNRRGQATRGKGLAGK